MKTVQRALNHDFNYQGTFYPATDEKREVPKALAERDKQLTDTGGEEGVPSPVDLSDGLPTAIPKPIRGVLESNGVTWEDLTEVDDFSSLENIGPSRAEDLEQAVDQVLRYHANADEDE